MEHIKSMTKQEIFDIVAPALLKQNERSAVDGILEGSIRCLYRGPNNTKCAAGFLIPDELYKPSMEGKLISTLIGLYSEFKYLEAEHDFVFEFQSMHDDQTIPVNSWKEKLIELANKYKVSTACIDNL